MQHPDPTPPPDDLASRLRAVRQRIAHATRAAGRDAKEITLVAVSKTHPAEAVAAAFAQGQAVFAENRVQEAQAKFPALCAAHPSIRLHLVGALQTNKVADAVRLAHVIESLDRPRLLDALAQAIERAGRAPEILVQVNVGNEPQKAGVAPAEADAFIESCRARLGSAVTGLMCVPPLDADPAPHFRALAACAARHGLAVLSMGMSGDFETAIACGATHVRIGSAIFGARPPA